MGKKEDFHEGVQELFQPTFGNRPMQYIGRDGVIEQFMAGLKEPVGSRKRLIEAGVIEAPRRGELVFAVPYLSEYLQNMDLTN